MDKSELTGKLTSYARLVRTEYHFSQDQMAQILGISKKSLVESEKGRRNLSWPECVALATIFSQSTVLQNAFGGELSDMIRAVAFADTKVVYPATMGGKVWWKVIKEIHGYRIQQNILSQHYRLLDPRDGRMMSSFKLEEILDYLAQLNLIDSSERSTEHEDIAQDETISVI